MMMWVVYREQKGHCRMYWCGGDWAGPRPLSAACWSDRRDAFRVADDLLDAYPGPVDAPYIYGEECVDVVVADPAQYIPTCASWCDRRRTA